MGKHGNARLLHPGLSRYGRLTPEAIYARAESREQAVRWLRANGYILDVGQVPTGAIRGQRIGFGQHGHGGAYKGGRNAEIIRALNTGVRDPLEIGTMTAAEQRMFTASRDLELVRQGVHPYSESALVRRGAQRIGGTELELTPEVAARFERHYYITMHAQGEALEMKRLQRLVPGKPLSAVDTAEVYAHNAARKIVLGERSAQARAAHEAIEEAKRTITDTPKPLAGGSNNGRYKGNRKVGPFPDEPWDEGFIMESSISAIEKRSVHYVPIRYRLTEDDLNIFWHGDGTHGGHKPSSRALYKTILPDTWTIEKYEAAIHSILKKPEYIREISLGKTEVRGQYEGVAFSVLVDGNPGKARKVVHAVPIHGAGVRYNDYDGLTDLLLDIPWRGGWRRVTY